MAWSNPFSRTKPAVPTAAPQTPAAMAGVSDSDGEIRHIRRSEMRSINSVEDLDGVLAAAIEPPIACQTMSWIQASVRSGVAESGADAWDMRVAGLVDELYRASAEAAVPPPATPDQRAADRERLVAADHALADMVTGTLRVERWLAKVARQRSVLAVTPVPTSRWTRGLVVLAAGAVGAAAAYAVGNLMAETVDLLFGRPWFYDQAESLGTSAEAASAAWATEFGYVAAAAQMAAPLVVLLVQCFHRVGWGTKLGLMTYEAAFAVAFTWMRTNSGMASLAGPAGSLEFAIAGLYTLALVTVGEAMSRQHELAVVARAHAQLLGAQLATLQERATALAASTQAAVKAVASLRLGEEAGEHIRRRVALASATAQLAYYEAVSAQACAADAIPDLRTRRAEVQPPAQA